MKLTYKTTDGTEFDTQEKAIAHENVTEAYKAYQDAVKKLQKSIGEKLVTADGFDFVLGGNTNYYYIRGEFSYCPAVVNVVVCYWNFHLSRHNYGRIKAEYYEDGKMTEIFCDIDSLYKFETNANEKLIKILEDKKTVIDGRISGIKKYIGN
jgi:predicted nucleic acid-binding Zn finger protein